MLACRTVLRQVGRLPRVVTATGIGSSKDVARTSPSTPCTQCTQLRLKHHISRPTKPAPEPINDLYEDPDLVSCCESRTFCCGIKY